MTHYPKILHYNTQFVYRHCSWLIRLLENKCIQIIASIKVNSLVWIFYVMFYVFIHFNFYYRYTTCKNNVFTEKRNFL